MHIAETAAVRLLEQHDVGSQPPIDVVLLAERMGIAVEFKRLPYAGRLRGANDGLRIEIDRGMGLARRRFTLAHELAHAALRQDRGPMLDRGREERYADRFASSLLLPREWIQERIARLDESLLALRCIAAEADVSLAAALMRLRETAEWCSTLLHWRHDLGDWRLFAITGLAPELRAGLVTTPSIRSALNAAHGSKAQEARARLVLAFGQTRVRVTAEVSVRYPGAIALADLRCLATENRGRRPNPRPSLESLAQALMDPEG